MRALSSSAEPEEEPEATVLAPPSSTGAVDFEGFNLDASVRIEAGDDLGRERLCRYGARPAFSLERLRWLPGGRLAYRIKKVRGGAKARVMTPLELLARLSALVPPPRYPLVRYSGVLGPRSSWRREVVPRPPRVPDREQPAAEAAPTTVRACRARSDGGDPVDAASKPGSDRRLRYGRLLAGPDRLSRRRSGSRLQGCWRRLRAPFAAVPSRDRP